MTMRSAALTLLCLAGTTPAFAQVDFRTDVEPIFREKCWECHGPKEQAGSLRLDRRRYALAGGTREQIVPGAPEKSRLFLSIAGLGEPEMPQEGALTAGQIDIVRQWIAEGAVWPEDPPDIHWVVDERVGPLLEAIRIGNFGAVRSAVSSHPELARAQDAHGATLLTETALHGDVAEVKWLLSKHADPNLATEAGHTALMLALDDPAKVRLLLDAGADATARTQSGRTTLQQAADRKRSAPILRLLLRHGATFEPGEGDPLVQVTRNGDLEAMKLLVNARGGRFPKPALKNAALSNCLPCLQLVLASEPEPKVIKEALVGSATMISNDMLRALLKAGADANASSAGNEAKTVLMQAVYSDYADTDRIKLLLDAGADVNARTPSGNTALSEARKKGATEIVTLLSSAARTNDGIRSAVSRSLPLLQETGPRFWAGSGCFSCHNNTLPDIAIGWARERGFAVKEDTIDLNRKQTLGWLDLRRERLLEGLPPAGGQNTMGSALFSLALTHVPPTDTLYAGARYQKALQTADGSWQVQNHRPPLVSSSISLTAMSIKGLIAYAPPSQTAEYARSVERAVKWLEQAQPRATEDYAFRILGLSWGSGSRRVIASTAQALVTGQHDDGGWSQLPALASDSYATGQALVALHEAGFAANDPVYVRGAKFLVDTQLADGSWHVKTRSEPSQTYFESGYPHGVDQFISAAGASWATAALALTQPPILQSSTR